VAERVIENLLGVSELPDRVEELSDALHGEFRARAQPVVDGALSGEKLAPERVARVLERIRERWDEVGYAGDYRAWIEAR